MAQGACGLRTGRAEQQPSRTSGPVLVSCAGLQQASPQPPGRGRLPQVLCEQEGWLQAGEAGDTSLRGPEPSCQPAGLHHHLLPSWRFAGVSPGRRMPQLHSRPGACSPLSPLRLRLVDTFPSTEEGGWLCPQDAGRLLLPPQDWPPRAGKLARACRWPSETIPSDCAKGLGIRVGVAGYHGAIPATFTAARVSPLTSAILTFELASRAVPSGSVERGRWGRLRCARVARGGGLGAAG